MGRLDRSGVGVFVSASGRGPSQWAWWSLREGSPFRSLKQVVFLSGFSLRPARSYLKEWTDRTSQTSQGYKTPLSVSQTWFHPKIML